MHTKMAIIFNRLTGIAKIVPPNTLCNLIMKNINTPNLPSVHAVGLSHLDMQKFLLNWPLTSDANMYIGSTVNHTAEIRKNIRLIMTQIFWICNFQHLKPYFLKPYSCTKNLIKNVAMIIDAIGVNTTSNILSPLSVIV